MITVSMSDVNLGEMLAAFLHPINLSHGPCPVVNGGSTKHGVIVTMNQCGRLWGPTCNDHRSAQFSATFCGNGIADEHVVPKSRSHIYFPLNCLSANYFPRTRHLPSN